MARNYDVKKAVVIDVRPFGTMNGLQTWKVLASKGPIRGRFVGFIQKKQITVPVKAWVYQARNTKHDLIGQAFTLPGAQKKFEGSIK